MSSPREQVVDGLKKWRSKTEGSYVCLMETLNKYSVFTGRNPLVSIYLKFLNAAL